MKSALSYLLLSGWLLSLVCLPAQAARPQVSISWNADQGFVLVNQQSSVKLVIDQLANTPVYKAAELLAGDFGLVFGKTLTIEPQLQDGNQIVIGELANSALIQQLVRKHQLDVKKLTNCYECYQFNFIKEQSSEILLIIGADRRGAAYGAIELSRAIGVSPWVWWADVEPQKRTLASLARRDLFFQSPSIKYRGMFINDEDFGLFPWAAFNFEKSGNIGLKTYDKVFELMLRLRANTLWPAMHEVSAPFNSDPANAKLADEYGIVMGSSHAEPLLRNNVGEWKFPAADYNYATNPQKVGDYWRERVETNQGYENIYTLGMRGIHDSAMQGAKTLDERKVLLDKVIDFQWSLLPKGDQAPAHIFVPYKEVLEVYAKGLSLPPNTIIVLPDDNFGYIRRFPNATDRKYSDKFGVYYHLSYLGSPLSYLWLATTPPELIKSELGRAYDAGISEFWMFNVGDIKPAEPLIDYVMSLAWDYPEISQLSQKAVLQRYYAHQFGIESAKNIAEIMDSYYTLNFERKPEHLQYYLPKEAPKMSGLSEAELFQRKMKADDLISRVQLLKPASNHNAWFELVEYPVLASAYAHLRFVNLELYAKHFPHNPTLGQQFGNQAVIADEHIKVLTHKYNTVVADGKWNYMMAEEPANNILASYRLNKPILPAFVKDLDVPNFTVKEGFSSGNIDLSRFNSRFWEWLPSINVLKSKSNNLSLELPFKFEPNKDYCINLDFLPSFSQTDDSRWLMTLKLGGDSYPITVESTYNDGVWGQGVLNNRLARKLTLTPKHDVKKLTLIARDKDLGLRGVRVEEKRCD